MPFREKKAWITLVTLALVLILFLVLMQFGAMNSQRFAIAHRILIAVITFVVVEAGLILLARQQSGEDARFPKDEREVLIDLKASRVAYIMFIVLTLLVTLVVLHVEGDTLGLGLHYLLAMVIAEMTRAITQIVLFRRDA